MKKIIKLTESDLHKIVKESVDKVINEGIDYNGEDAYDEIDHYMQKINDVYDEIRHLKIINRNANNDGRIKEDINLLERYIKMMYSHIYKLQQNVEPFPTMSQILKEPTPLVHY